MSTEHNTYYPEPKSRTSRGDKTFSVGDEEEGAYGYKRNIEHRIQLDHNENTGILNPDRIYYLPSTAKRFYDKFGDARFKVRGWNPLLATILSGTRDNDDDNDDDDDNNNNNNDHNRSPLSMLRNHEKTIVREIYEFLGGAQDWANHVKLTIPAKSVGNAEDQRVLQYADGRRTRENTENEFLLPWIKIIHPRSSGYRDGFVAYARCGRVEFPKPNDRNVIMMPFIFGDRGSLPENLQCYYPLIQQCPYMKEEIGKVGYLTIREKYLDAGKMLLYNENSNLCIQPPDLFRDDRNAAAFTPALEHPLQVGTFFGPDRYEGGMYIATNMNGAFQIYDALIDKKVKGIVGRNGSCDHFRHILAGSNSTLLGAGELIWMTDCTPIQEISKPDAGVCQFFCVTSPYISYWDADRWTPNPFGITAPNEVALSRHQA